MLGYVLAAAALIVLGLYHILPRWLADSAAGVVVIAGVVSFVRTIRQVNQITGAMGTAALIGRQATVRTPLSPRGFVVIRGERWAAELESGSAAAGEQVEIVGAEGFRLKVRKPAVDEPRAPNDEAQ
ncbi:MAG TPA: NfeD family protein [Tepidiformaceae bacterium]|nr:NfeD family protein [Tepidiformaceae bacterium]